MEIICSWCGSRIVGSSSATEPGVTHGMCAQCYERSSVDLWIETSGFRHSLMSAPDSVLHWLAGEVGPPFWAEVGNMLKRAATVEIAARGRKEGEA